MRPTTRDIAQAAIDVRVHERERTRLYRSAPEEHTTGEWGILGECCVEGCSRCITEGTIKAISARLKPLRARHRRLLDAWLDGGDSPTG